MKVLFLLVLALRLSGEAKSDEVPVVAQENKKEPVEVATSKEKKTSNVYDLMYFPAKGTLFGASEYNYSDIEQSVDYQGREFVKAKVKTSKLEQTVGYAFDSNSYAGASLSYKVDSTTSMSYGPGSTLNGQSVKNKSEQGLEEPIFFLKERIKSQEGDNFNIDLKLEFSPKMGNKKEANVTKKGNGLRGASTLGIEGEVGKKSDHNSWKLGVMFHRTGEGKSEDAALSADRTTSDPSNLFGFAFTYQWLINPDFEINLNAGIAFVGEMNSVNPYTQVKNEIDSSTAFTFGPTFILNLSPKSTIELGIVGISEAEKTFKQTDTTDGSSVSLDYKESTYATVNIAAKYEF